MANIEIESLKAALAEMEAERDAWRNCAEQNSSEKIATKMKLNRAVAERDELRAEVERLRAALIDAVDHEYPSQEYHDLIKEARRAMGGDQ